MDCFGAFLDGASIDDDGDDDDDSKRGLLRSSFGSHRLFNLKWIIFDCLGSFLDGSLADADDGANNAGLSQSKLVVTLLILSFCLFDDSSGYFANANAGNNYETGDGGGGLSQSK